MKNQPPSQGNLIKPVVRNTAAGMKEVVPGTPFKKMMFLLNNGYDIHLTGTYGFALSFYSWIKQQVRKKVPVRDYLSSRKHRAMLHASLSKLWIRVHDGKACLDKAPVNQWLNDFYPGMSVLYMTFPDYLGLNGARQWYEKGIRYPVINHTVHPFYGVYFPTRFGHLHLFDRWLAGIDKIFTGALDIGAGCGILSFIMYKRGIGKVAATDINPNAIYSIRMDVQRSDIYPGHSILAEQGSFFGQFLPGADDLVVCNPPWIPGKAETALDGGCYYQAGFFDRLFDELRDKCLPGTTICILFSDFAQVAGITGEHPVEDMLETHRSDFTMIAYDRQKVEEKATRSRSWVQQIRNNEHTELFVFTRK